MTSHNRATLLKLPHEIFDEIMALVAAAPDPIGPQPNPEDTVEDYHNERMGALCRQEMPWELKHLATLSSTCSYFRNYLAPHIFGTVYLRNSRKSALSIKALGSGSQRHLVKAIRYAGFPKLIFPAWNPETREKTYPGGAEAFLKDITKSCPPELEDTLGNLTSLFPKLRHLTVEFPFLYDNVVGLHGRGERIACKVDDDRTPWKVLVARSWAAVCRNEAKLDSLHLENFQCLKTDSFGNGLNPILNNLKEFSIHYQRWVGGPRWRLHRGDGDLGEYAVYQLSAVAMKAEFFDHLSQCETLSIHYNYGCPVDETEEGREKPFLLEERHVKKLRSLEISNYFVDDDLANFVVARSQTLESIKMNECHCADGEYTWETFFRKLTDTSSGRLVHFEISNHESETWAESYPYPDGAGGLLSDAAKGRVAAMKADGKRVFPYKIVDTPYGDLFVDHEAIERNLLLGEDGKAYDVFMATRSSVRY